MKHDERWCGIIGWLQVNPSCSDASALMSTQSLDVSRTRFHHQKAVVTTGTYKEDLIVQDGITLSDSSVALDLGNTETSAREDRGGLEQRQQQQDTGTGSAATAGVSNKKPSTYQCSLCSAVLSSAGVLVDHMRTHTGERPYACTFCDYKATQAPNLKRHLRIHTGERPFKCSHCQYRAIQKANLQRHMLSTHGVIFDTQSKP